MSALPAWRARLAALWSATRFELPELEDYARDLMLAETRRGLVLLAVLSLVLLLAALGLQWLREGPAGAPLLTLALLAALALHVLVSARAVQDIKVLHLLGMVLLVVAGTGFMLLAHRLGVLSAGLMAGFVLLFMVMPLMPWGLREAATVIALVYTLLTASAFSVTGRFEHDALWTLQFLVLAAAGVASVLIARNVHVRKRDLMARFHLDRARADLERLSDTDPPTGAWNRRFLERRLPELAERCRREGTPCELAILDVDGFKGINDAFGHHFGDEVLKTLAGVFQAHLPGTAWLVRLGGDEFAVVQAGTGLAELVGRCLRHLETHPELLRRTGGQAARVSVGLTRFEAGELPALAALYRAADAELYVMKAARQRARESDSGVDEGKVA